MRAAAVGLADIARATHALRPRGRAVEILLEMCGLERLSPRSTIDSETANIDVPDDEVPEELGPTSHVDAAASLPTSVRRLEPVRAAPLRTFETTEDPLAAEPQRVPGVVPRYDPLLGDSVAVDLLRAAAAVWTRSDQPDIDALVHRLSFARTLAEIPRLHAPTLTAGMQILVDVGTSMEPFTDDQRHVVDHVVPMVGGSMSVSYFVDDPAPGAGPDRRPRTWTPFVLPSLGQPVVVISDLGCGVPWRAKAIAGWLRLSDELRRRGSRIVVLAPTRLERMPLELQQRCEIVVWDHEPGRQFAAALARSDHAGR
jgi:hypothetical protein